MITQGMHPFEQVLLERFEGAIESGEHDSVQERHQGLAVRSGLARGRGFSDKR